MRTLNYPFPSEQSRENLEEIAAVCRDGGIIVYPTETFYAIGGNALDSGLVARISDLKQRDPGKPFPVIANSPEALARLLADWPPAARTLAAEFWPGPLSLILPGYSNLPAGILDDGGGVAVRWAAHPLLDLVCRFTALPLISTSANPGGKAPAIRAADLDRTLLQKVDLLIVADKKPLPKRSALKPSTIVDLRPDSPEIIREGAVRSSAVKNCLAHPPT
ncbi:MAG: threonylcarbamoyl-AMP synthase [Deltaproteobacteria bacterium]|nr:threonylcarbamoyl-AMP synthase [Deltaproteobacteria bacterium]